MRPPILAGCVSLAAAIASLGQTPTAPKFEVTSVRPYKPIAGQARHVEFGCSNGRFVSLAQNLRAALFWAYDVKSFQVSGLPKWIDANDGVFDIEAKAAGPVSEDQCKLMFQTLLAERFKLTLHRETKELVAYALVVAKNGPKMRAVTPDSEPNPKGGVRIMGNPVRSMATSDSPRGWSIAQLVNYLPGIPALEGRPVFDRTGLEGIYEFDLEFAFLPNIQPPRPDIFEAVQEQLGLKLNSIKEPIGMLVIDRLERPDAN